MTLSQDGINYICLNFGDAINNCCVPSGLSWYFTLEGNNYNETGSTAMIIGRLASGLIDSLTMTSPDRGTFTQAELNAANKSSVTITDAQQIEAHDEPHEGQYCYGEPPPPECVEYTTQAECLAAGCYWWNGACHSNPPQLCSDLNNEIECLSYDCLWYDGSCHAAPRPEIPYWWWIPVVAGVSIIGLYVAAKKKG